jgi:hypothetical protein
MAELGPSRTDWRWPAWVWAVLVVLAMGGYFIGLDGQHIPKNGDEFVYAHIARLTALSGEWLPLQSSFEHMRNTKPPPLFWQAMVAGDWYRHNGAEWTLWNLRLPGVLYTLATALMAGAVAWRLASPRLQQGNTWMGTSSVHGGGSSFFSGLSRPSLAPQRFATGALAALLFLAFFSTYRNGRPYLTSGPETFWLFLPFAVIAWAPRAALASNWAFPALCGVAVGLGCLYKSFALVVPGALALGVCHLWLAPHRWQAAALAAVMWRVGLASAIALGLFSVWFAIDPDPGAVWREFVVGENAGKFRSAEGFWARFLSGPNSIWMMLINYPLNTGLLMFVTLGLVWAAWRQREPAGNVASSVLGQRALWVWLLVLLVVFSAPSQRSARYLLPAMPGLAVLMALYWGRIPRAWFMATLLVASAAVVVTALIARGAVQATGDVALYPLGFWLGLGLILVAALAGLAFKRLTRPVTALMSGALLAAFACLTLPFDGPIARFDAATVARLQGETVAVPSNFNGQFERYEFLIRGAKVKDYFAEQPTEFKDLAPLLSQHRFVLLQRRLGTPRDQVCLGVPGCRIVAERWDIRSRHTRAETARNALQQPGEFWFAKEYLLERAP